MSHSKDLDVCKYCDETYCQHCSEMSGYCSMGCFLWATNGGVPEKDSAEVKNEKPKL